MPKIQAIKGSKKLLNAWAFYDWANSVYTLTIASSIFPIFYSALFSSEDELVSAFGFEMKPTVLIEIITAFTFLVVAISSPILSGIADYIGNKKNFMKFFCYLGSIGCLGLYWFNLDYIHTSLLFYFMGLLGYWGSLVFYNSYLPDIVGIWWALFSQYCFAILPKGVSSGHKVNKDVLLNGFKELQSVWKQLQQNLRLKRYLEAFFVFSMAVQTIMLIAVYFGEKEIEWTNNDEKTTGLIISILVIQLVAIAGAYLTSKASDSFGNIKTLIAVNAIWMCLCVYAYFMKTPTEFYLAAGFVGLVMGGVQALARSTYSKFLPETEDTTSYFSFFDVAEKIGIVIGMIIFAVVDHKYNMRYAILFLVLFFLVGIVLLFRVPKEN